MGSVTQPEGALSVSRLIDETQAALHGYVRDQAQVTDLVQAMDPIQLTGSVSEGSQLSRGLIEVDDELMHIKGVEPSGVFAVQPWGRGQSGTTAADHAVGAKVTMSPLYPRKVVRDGIYWCLREMFPRVFAVREQLYDVDVVRTNFPLPDDCWQVFAVEWSVPGPSRMWQRMFRWRMNNTATTTEIELLGRRWPGPEKLRVLYAVQPPASYEFDDLTAYGYTQHLHDIIVMGTTARLLMLTEPARLQVESVESHGRSEVVEGGTLTQVAQRMYALFDRRVEQESLRLMQRFPPRMHLTR